MSEHRIEVESGESLRLKTAGKYCDRDIVVTASGGGDCAAIIDVTELPDTDINDSVFYRLLTGTFYFNGAPQGNWTCYIVQTLPSEGVPVTLDMVHVTLYYAADTGGVSGYIAPALSSMVGVPVGWYPVEVLAQAFGLAWGGIIWDESEDPIDGVNRLLLKYSVYQHKKDWYDLSDRVGWHGTGGGGSEVFNSLANIASGASGHAEGYSTTASGNSSHAEGDYATASGNISHAEGYSTTASGIGSHAEGVFTTASGSSSHAEGYYATASGEDSHAEGEHTIAGRKGQHAQGRFNLKDASGTDESQYGKYAHIVGNGTDVNNRSNAHTLDWNGLGWFAGGLKVGGTGQDDPNAEEILTKSQVQAMIDEAIAKLNL